MDNSKHERGMVTEYWKGIGGTLVREFVMVNRTAERGLRKADAVIILNQEHKDLQTEQMAILIRRGDDLNI
jgi:hypothetical protein